MRVPPSGDFAAAHAGQQCAVSELHARLLERAVRILGGAEEVADYLGVSPGWIRIWMRGLSTLPDDLFLKLVDLTSEPPSLRGGDPRRAEKPK